MRIVLDAMGTDRAPLPEVEGALRIASHSNTNIILVGDEARLRDALAGRRERPNVSIVHASEAITMNDSPVLAVRHKKDASLLVALRLVKRGEADAVVSAGNTGALMVAARTILAPIKGVARSAICQMLPTTTHHPVLVLDLGANVDCTARHLCDFAEMGTVYSRWALGVQNPRVGLLNIGEEQLKGNELAKTVHRNLTGAPHINFIGNVEPKAMYEGAADVVVCDGFVGNVVLKTSEGAAAFMAQLMKREFGSTLLSRMGALLSGGAFKRVKRAIDAEEYPGAPLLGVKGVVILLHGASSGKGVANAIRGACRAVESKINERIRAGIEELRSAEAALKHEETVG